MNRVLFLLVLMAAAAGARADIYKWTDENGGVHFGDDAKGKSRAEKIDVKVVTYTHVTYQKLKANATPADTGPKRVVLYGTNWCGYCAKARAYFQARNIAFTDIDIEADANGKAQFKAMGGRGVPVILVGETRMNGFNEAAFAGLYNRRQVP